MKFSERKNFKTYSTLIQTNEMNAELRISLWNVLLLFKWNFKHNYFEEKIEDFSRYLWFAYLKKPIDERPDTPYKILQIIRTYFMECDWHEVYDFLEFTLMYYKDEQLTEYINAVLERELSGYRFINGIISDITDCQEKEMLEQALGDNDFPGVRAHLERAFKMLSDKKSPDYRNSIKESISAVESLAIILSDCPKATLGEALKIIEKKGKLHSALKDGFSKLYGYTSDEGGIRHAMLEEPNLSAADAKFFLLSCTSFINYLKSKA